MMVQRRAAAPTAIFLSFCALLSVASAWAWPAWAEPPKTHLFAAASLQAPLEKITTAYRQKTGVQVVLVTGSSGDLARQIEQGAPAHLFISASAEWMDYLETLNLTLPGTRRYLLGNRLAAITSPCVDKISASIADLLVHFKISRIALANPDTAPAGAYAKQALIKLGRWEDVARRVAYSEDVRAALGWVARCESDLGFVYKTDALAGEKLGLHLAAEFPPETHAPIFYPLALITGSDTPQTRAFVRYLVGAEAFAIFETFGFTKP